MPFAVAYLPQNTATVIKFTNSFFLQILIFYYYRNGNTNIKRLIKNSLTLHFIMLKNGKTYFKNRAL